MISESGNKSGGGPDGQDLIGGVQIDTKEKPPTEIDALRLLKESLRDKPPRFKELPDVVGLADNYLDFVKSLTAAYHGNNYSIFELNEMLRKKGDVDRVETGASIVVDNKMGLRLGPLIKGEPSQIKVASVLEKRWLDLPNQSGKILRGDKITAFFHSHPVDQTFSDGDLRALFGNELLQLYVTAGKKDIYLLQSTLESARMEREELKKIIMEYGVEARLIVENSHYDDVASGRLHKLLTTVAQRLKLGYYSNRTSKKSAELQLAK
ncbi:MAG: hypothetical protein Q7S24_00175 [bacterium]|nr:hypothetical protein [bacterium]